jgi:hypothetical protein
MGDPSGSRDYAELSTEPLSKWKRTFANAYRKAWARRYLDSIGRERLGTMGYDLDELQQELASIPNRPKGLLSDTWRGAYGRATQLRRDRALDRLTKRGRW